ncbi:hypothetical protein [Belnapia sp. F-4-1]|uniref:hypothetical protein n=1 Tax=Belnapia sp. F-4-1 TaxID=1545443 RepID=UPI0005B78297|nr:hypothetical protein [Belnapia sp. F-4-1]
MSSATEPGAEGFLGVLERMQADQALDGDRYGTRGEDGRDMPNGGSALERLTEQRFSVERDVVIERAIRQSFVNPST